MPPAAGAAQRRNAASSSPTASSPEGAAGRANAGTVTASLNSVAVSLLPLYAAT